MWLWRWRWRWRWRWMGGRLCRGPRKLPGPLVPGRHCCRKCFIFPALILLFLKFCQHNHLCGVCSIFYNNKAATTAATKCKCARHFCLLGHMYSVRKLTQMWQKKCIYKIYKIVNIHSLYIHAVRAGTKITFQFEQADKLVKKLCM